MQCYDIDITTLNNIKAQQHKSTQDSLLSPVERGILPLKIKFRPEKTNLVEMREQFRLQPRLSESLNVGIRLGDMQYTLETEVFAGQDRWPICN